MDRRIGSVLFSFTFFLAACGSGGSGDQADAFGIPSRTVVESLNFPTGQAQPGTLDAVPAFPNLSFDAPVFLTSPADGTDRIFVVELGGEIHVFDNDATETTTDVFLDLSGQIQTGGEQGLLGFAFHPAYAQSGLFYVNYIAPSPRRTVISRFQVTANPNLADASSETILLEYNQPFTNHNGGMLAFGPDGMLYISSGDGGSGGDPQNNGQSLTTLLGKILRIDPSGAIPPDNPLVGQGGGVREEIWAYGLRNPWRFSFDRNAGTLWCGDVGQGDREEIDIIEKGDNLGWRYFEGNQEYNNPAGLPASNFVAPIVDYAHSEGLSVTGGYVYRGFALPSLFGAYLYADYASDKVWALVYENGQVISNTLVANVQGPASFGEDAQGEVYVCSLAGTIYRFEETQGGGGPVPFPQLLSDTGIFADLATLESNPGIIEYNVNSPLWSDGARKRRWLALPGRSQIGYSATGAWDFPVDTVLVKHFEIEVTGGATRRLETRVLLRQSSGWEGYTYRWNPTETDADLLNAAATDTFTVDDPTAPGGQRSQTWYFPSRTDCLSCHTSAAGRVLGVRTRQINRDFDYPVRLDNQLRAWNHIELFDIDIGDHLTYQALIDPANGTASAEARGRSYLTANCAFCHLPGGPTPVDLDLRFDTAAAAMNVINVPSTNDPGLFRVDPGAKEASVLWDLMGRVDGQRMPPLGSSVVDDTGLDAVGAWIDADAP